jgi:hypothetical protein
MNIERTIAAIRTLRENVALSHTGLQDSLDEITAVARTDEGRAELHALICVFEQVLCTLKTALAKPILD